MRYQRLLGFLGVSLIVLSAVERGWFWLGIWPGANFLALARGLSKRTHTLFGKRHDGTIPFWSRTLFLPLYIYTELIWRVYRLTTRDPMISRVNDRLSLGRRILPSEFTKEFENFIDLTAEFSEPSAIRCSPGYRAFPILDGSAPSADELLLAVRSIPAGRTYVHCAKGQGRAALFALAKLIHDDDVATIAEGITLLTNARPCIRLNDIQMKCIEEFVSAREKASR